MADLGKISAGAPFLVELNCVSGQPNPTRFDLLPLQISYMCLSLSNNANDIDLMSRSIDCI